LHGRVFGPHDRRLCSKVFQDEDNEVLTKVNRQLFGRRPTFTKLNGDYNFSSEISSEKSNRILGPSSVKKDDNLQKGWINSFSLSLALSSFAKLVNDYRSDQDKLLSGVGCDRLTTWFDFALEENCIPWEHNE
uniref:Uncharacterized protein n=1 Tax=Romanomermis culicivorax TaxID=13658 RepID=A0A915JHN0_ROMCU